MKPFIYRNYCVKGFFSEISIMENTGCLVFTDIFQELLIGTSNAQLLMTNDSFSSQTWAILYLNETLIKSQNRTQPNDSPVRCQNQEYFQTHMNLP